MAKYEVHIPAATAGGFNMTLKVSADNWMAALKAGMQKLGEQGAVTQNVMVDIQDDNSIHVTEPASGRVFRIRELSEEEAAQANVKKPATRPGTPAVAKAPAAPAPTSREMKTETGMPAVQAPPDLAKTLPPTPMPEAARTMPATSRDQLPPTPGLNAPVAAPPPSALKAAPATGPAATRPATGPGTGRPPTGRRPATKSSPRIDPADIEELEHPVKPVTGPIGRKSGVNVGADIRRQTEELLADVFMRISDLDGKTNIEDAMQFILDLAMEKVPCEAGSILRADGASGNLSFIVARGPKAKELLAQKLIIPSGTGIAGFCSFEGVSVAVSDVEKDPRFYSGVGEKVDYTSKSLLCSPMMTHGRSFGAMQLINRRGGPHFLEHEVGVLAYLSHQAALYLNNRI